MADERRGADTRPASDSDRDKSGRFSGGEGGRKGRASS
jgi:hypothetical protein